MNFHNKGVYNMNYTKWWWIFIWAACIWVGGWLGSVIKGEPANYSILLGMMIGYLSGAFWMRYIMKLHHEKANYD